MTRNAVNETERAYLDLLVEVLTDYLNVGEGLSDDERQKAKDLRLNGLDWPAHALTMIGVKRLAQFRDAVETVVTQSIRGDIIETGVWRGGACIMARAALRAHGVTDRTVWVADSFQGLPPPEPDTYPADTGDQHYLQTFLKVDRAHVEGAFARFGLLDDQVRFLEGWFKDTLKTAPIDHVSVLRLDGDMYQSTMEALEALYHKVSPGGFVIVDDYGAVAGCRQAVDDFRAREDIHAPLVQIDWTGHFWRVPLRTHPDLPPLSTQYEGDNLDIWPGYALGEAQKLVERAQGVFAEDDSPEARGQVEDLALQALEIDPNAMPAHVLLARLALPGPDYLQVLADYHQRYTPGTYLEIGVFKGESLRLANASTRCIAIDPAPQPEATATLAANQAIFLTTSDAFFEAGYGQHYLAGPGYDFAFIDGAHGFEHVLRDFINAEAFAAPGAVIAIHDCLPLDPLTASAHRQTTFYSGDGWKLLKVLSDLRPDLRVRVIETFPTGLVFISHLSPVSRYLRDHYTDVVTRYRGLEWSDYGHHYDREMVRISNTGDALESAIVTAMKSYQRAFSDRGAWQSWSGAVPEIFDPSQIHKTARFCQISGIVDDAGQLKTVTANGLNYREDLLVDDVSSRDRAVYLLAGHDRKQVQKVDDLHFADRPFSLNADQALYLCDVLQTVSDCRRLLYLARVKMAAGAILYATVPFGYHEDATLLIQPGDPADTAYPADWKCIPGWSLPTDALAAGFSSAEIVFISRPDLAILGAEIAGVFVLRAVA